jgi:hypothetical protein
MSSDLEPLEDLPFAEDKLPAPSTTALIRLECTRKLQRQRMLSGGWRFLITLALALAGVLVIAVTRGGELAPLEPLLSSALYGALGWAAVLLAVFALGILRPPGTRATGWIRVSVAVLVPATFLIYLAFLASDRLPIQEALGSSSIMACGVHTLLASAGVALGVMLPWRRTDPFNPGLTGALLALGGALAASIAMGVVCPSREGWHLWLAHGLTLISIVLVGAWIGRRWLAP